MSENELNQVNNSKLTTYFYLYSLFFFQKRVDNSISGSQSKKSLQKKSNLFTLKRFSSQASQSTDNVDESLNGTVESIPASQTSSKRIRLVSNSTVMKY